MISDCRTIYILQASTERDLDTVFSTLVEKRVGGLAIAADTFFSSQSEQSAALAFRYAMPTISPYREFVRAGGMMSYGGSITEQYRLVGVYVGRILKGEDAGRPSSAASQQSGIDGKPQDREGAGRYRATDAARPRR